MTQGSYALQNGERITKSMRNPSVPREKKTLKDEVILRGIKIVDIIYIGIIYFVLSYIVSKILDAYLGPFNKSEADKKSTFILEFEVAMHIIVLYILTYFARNIVELIPFPLDGVWGYNHLRLKELSSAALFFFVLTTYQTNLVKKMTYLAEK